MKKVIYAALISVVLLSQTACSFGTAQKAIEQAKLSIASGDYRTALNSLQLAKDEGFRNKEVEEMIQIIDKYLAAKDAFDAADMDSAKAALGEMPEAYTEYPIKDSVDLLKADIEKKNLVMGDVNAQIAGVREMLAGGDYVSASANITELYTKELTEYQKNQVDEMNSTLQSAQAKIKEAEDKKPDVVYVQQNPPSSNTNVVATYYVVNCNEYITLRSAPSTSASALARIPLGQAVGYIENAGNGFYKINYDGAVGYSLASYLSSSNPSASSSSRATAKVVNAKEFITLRSSPSTSASEITKIPAGAYVTYLGTASNGFYRIEYNGMQGYGLQSYLQIQ